MARASGWQGLVEAFSRMAEPGALPEGALAVWLESQSTVQTLVVTQGSSEADGLVLNLRGKALLFPEVDVPLFRDGSTDPQRLSVLSALADGEPVMVVAHLLSLLQPVAARERLQRYEVRAGTSVGRLLEWLETAGYRRSRSVTEVGEICLHGSVLDIYPADAEPTRLRLSEPRDDEDRHIDSLETFSVHTQRSDEERESLKLSPVREPKRTSRLESHLEPQARVILVDPARLQERLERMAEAVADGWKYSSYADLELLHNERRDDWQELLEAFGTRPLVQVSTGEHPEFSEIPELEGYAGFSDWIVNQPKPWFWVTGRGRRVKANLTRRKLSGVEVVEGWLSRGFSHPKLGTVCTDREVFGEFRPPAPEFSDPSLQHLPNFSKGDLVVHRERGLGRFEGLVSVDILGQRRDMLKMSFANDDSLLVPPEHIDQLSAYRSAQDDEPSLTELGKAAWGRTLEKAQAAARQAARQLKKQRVRKAAPALPADSPMQESMEEAFAYDETTSQLEALEAIKGDLEKPEAMERLLCGDVGFGKTEVAIRAAFKVAQAGLQVAVLVPTTVLAQQHTLEFAQRMADWGVEVAPMFAGNEGEDTLARLADGSLPVVVGTHRLLSSEVRFARLGLVITDEEQQFGLAHKRALRSLKEGVHSLSISATPIPRTLQQALSGMCDISRLEAPPQHKRPIRTYLCEEQPKLYVAALVRELERDGQAFVLHNRVRELPALRNRLAKQLPGVRFGIAHGQLEPEALQQVLSDFREGQLDVLVCSTIIESGVNLPKVNTILVKDAHRFGLAQLYQIRGRVGRGSQQAYCYLFVPKDEQIQEKARYRLDTLRTMTRLGSGLEIARRDLELRGAGDLLGKTQTGSINKVGYTLFQQLLSEALHPESVKEPQRVHLDLPVQAYIPEDYLSDTGSRIALYQRLAGVENERQLQRLKEEISDRYGDLPDPLDNLVQLARLRLLAEARGMKHLRVDKNFGVCVLWADQTKLAELAPGSEPLTVALEVLTRETA